MTETLRATTRRMSRLGAIATAAMTVALAACTWSLRTAARFTGVDAGYMCHLEHGPRVPSIVVAEAFISGLKLSRTQ